MPPEKRAREAESKAEEEKEEVDAKSRGFRAEKALLRQQIVLNVVKTLEPQEPESLFMAFNTGKTGKYESSNPFPRILDRMLQKIEHPHSLQYAKVLPGSKAQSNERDYLLMNASECGKEGFDYDFEDSEGEELDRDELEDHIANMFVAVKENGYATAREMQLKQNCNFHEVSWVTVHVTEAS
jgi:hypothetical protein